ncbi:DciA family protein [Streptomyces sanyensis]|uniref:DciA family protein n=1 Tax=Streptomyces sanyensis TaxID=568869 RepID=UPI003D7853A7
MSGGETSGVDLARVALRAAMEAARKNGSGQKAKQKPRPVRTARRDGREPIGLGAAIGALVTERAWELPAASATLRERWAAIAPEFAGHVAAVSFNADSGWLTVCPESSAWATKARLEQTRIVAATNKAAGRTVVRALRILPPAAAPVSAPDAAPAAPTGPAKTRETASEGYRRALAAHQETARTAPGDPAIADAVERHGWSMRPPAANWPGCRASAATAARRPASPIELADQGEQLVRSEGGVLGLQVGNELFGNVRADGWCPGPAASPPGSRAGRALRRCSPTGWCGAWTSSCAPVA